MKVLKHTHWIFYLLFALACARQTAPTGGPKDSIPPTLIASIPKQGQVNFKGTSVELSFSESILLSNPKEQILITPSIGKAFDIKAKKNQVTITFQEPLNDSTTYAINFREAVQDITEKNPAEMLKLAFSTGPYIDSLSIEGTVYDALEATAIKDATVALYQNDTFDIFKHNPVYITKSDAKGTFRIENLKPGRYFIYGMEDKNKNLLADSKSEAFGFLRDSIQLEKNVSGVTLPFFHLDSRPLKLTSARPSNTYFNIKAAKNLTTFNFMPPGKEPIVASFGPDQTNVYVYNTFPDSDSVLTRFTARDSLNNLVDTTFYIKFSDRNATPEPFNLQLSRFQVTGTKGLINGQIKFTKPVIELNFDSIYYSIDSTQRVSFDRTNIRWDSLHNILFLEKTFDKSLLPKAVDPVSRPISRAPQRPSAGNPTTKAPIEHQLYLGNAAFISIEGDSSKKLTERLPPSTLEDTGILLVEIKTEAKHFLVQLMTKDFEVIASKRNTKKFNFEDLKPGDYQLRLVIDENNDGKWSPGNFYIFQEPEPVIFYKNEKGAPILSLKANWELGPLLITH
ncbi:MAG TPA: Ig-like domain-containing protein [Chryseolinea sp.]